MGRFGGDEGLTHAILGGAQQGMEFGKLRRQQKEEEDLRTFLNGNLGLDPSTPLGVATAEYENRKRLSFARDKGAIDEGFAHDRFNYEQRGHLDSYGQQLNIAQPYKEAAADNAAARSRENWDYQQRGHLAYADQGARMQDQRLQDEYGANGPVQPSGELLRAQALEAAKQSGFDQREKTRRELARAAKELSLHKSRFGPDGPQISEKRYNDEMFAAQMQFADPKWKPQTEFDPRVHPNYHPDVSRANDNIAAATHKMNYAHADLAKANEEWSKTTAGDQKKMYADMSREAQRRFDAADAERAHWVDQKYRAVLHLYGPEVASQTQDAPMPAMGPAQPPAGATPQAPAPSGRGWWDARGGAPAGPVQGPGSPQGRPWWNANGAGAVAPAAPQAAAPGGAAPMGGAPMAPGPSSTGATSPFPGVDAATLVTLKRAIAALPDPEYRQQFAEDAVDQLMPDDDEQAYTLLQALLGGR